MAIIKAVNGTAKTHAGMKNVIDYVLDEEKTEDLTYVSGYYEPADPDKINADNVYQEFLKVKEQWAKDSGRMYAHTVLSFHKDEDLTPAEALELGKEYVEQVYPEHQVLLAVHQDKEHLHVHMVINTVSYIDGRKLHTTKQDLQGHKEICNKICREHSLHIAEKGRHFDGTEIQPGEVKAWDKNLYQALKKENSYVAECGVAVLNSLDTAKDRETFIQAMNEQGWATKWTDSRAHITFQDKDGHKVRDTKLLKTFSIDATKGGIISELKRQTEQATADREAEAIERARCGGYDRSTEQRERKAERRKQETAERDTEEIRTDTGIELDNSREQRREQELKRKNRQIERERRRTEREREEQRRCKEIEGRSREPEERSREPERSVKSIGRNHGTGR